MQPGGGQPDMQQILQQAQQMQEQLMAVQSELEQTDVRGQAGNGLVTVTMTGTGEVKGVDIDPTVVDPADVETLQDLVYGAIDQAQQSVSELTQDKMGPLSGAGGPGGGLGLPGL